MRFGLQLMVLLGAVLFGAVAVSAQEEKPESKPAAEAEHGAPAESATQAGQAPAESAGHTAEAHAQGEHAGDDHASHGTDLSHNNAGPSLEKPEEWKYDLAIWTLLVFFLLMLILGKFAWGPISEGLEKREHSIENMISDAKRNQDEAKALLANYESKLATSQEEIREMYAQARREAEGISAKIVAEAQAAASRERDRAVAEIDQAKNAALSEVAAKSVDIAMGLAGKIVRRQITGEDQRALLHEAVGGIASRN
jgi:F-type H+-transporting ATPase subunit b